MINLATKYGELAVLFNESVKNWLYVDLRVFGNRHKFTTSKHIVYSSDSYHLEKSNALQILMN